MRRSLEFLLLACLLAHALVACSPGTSCFLWTCDPAHEEPDPPNGAVTIDLQDVGPTTRSVFDAVAITRGFLAEMREEIASPQIHVVANVRAVWGLPARDAWTVDPCIPKLDDDRTVWITIGEGDYLNLRDRTWSRRWGQFDAGFELACREAHRSGTVVLDDATGEILGVYPGDHRDLQAPG